MVRVVLPTRHPALRCDLDPLCLTRDAWPAPPLDGEPRCGALDAALGMWLFPSPQPVPASAALIPFAQNGSVLVIGSLDPQRFHAHMGTAVLRRLGDLAGAALPMDRVP